MLNISYDMIFYNANIITMDPTYEIAEMVGIYRDKFVYVGKNQLKFLDNAIEAIDLGGKTIIPGFIDLHTHLCKEADIISINLGSFNSYEDTIKRIESEVKSKKDQEWVFASNWDESKWEDSIWFLSIQ
jgi:predicted amidohydrolase YtcJ